MWVSAAFTLFTAILALGLRFLLVWENKRLDGKYGSRTSKQDEGSGLPEGMAEAGTENYGPSFRYVL